MIYNLKAADHKGWFSLEASFFSILPTKSNGRHKIVECSYEQIPSSCRNYFLHLWYSLCLFSSCSIVVGMQRPQPQIIPIYFGMPIYNWETTALTQSPSALQITLLYTKYLRHSVFSLKLLTEVFKDYFVQLLKRAGAILSPNCIISAFVTVLACFS